MRAAVAAGVLSLACARVALAGSSLAEVDAAARAAGNRKPVAIAVGRKLFAQMRPVQILKVRVDGVGRHQIAGILLSGVKFHEPLGPGGFVSEVADIVRETFAASDVEEVDVWAIVPLRVGQHAVVAGDKAVPTSRVVYGATVRRGDDRGLPARLTAGDAVYWDPAWKASLQAP